MPRPLPTLILILTSVLLCTAPGCSLRYDTDELPRKSDGTDGDEADASGVDPSDASPDPADAAPLPDAAVCGDDGLACCESGPPCGFDPFIECNEKTSMCEECGEENGACCETGDECQNLALFGCGTDGVCSLLPL